MMKRIILLSVLFVPFAAKAEQQSPEALQKIIVVLQAQRNQAMDMAASADVRSATLAEELDKANARIKELEPKTAPKNK